MVDQAQPASSVRYKELVDRIIERSQVTPATARAVADAFVEELGGALRAGGRVKMPFGVMKSAVQEDGSVLVRAKLPASVERT